MTKEKVLVLRLKLRHTVSGPELRAMIEEAVESWGGSLHPDDPLFNAVESAEAKMFNWRKW